MSKIKNSPRVLILAAGSGSRLLPLTEDRPKCMVDFFGKTLLQRQLEVFNRHGIYEIAIVTGYCAQAVEKTNLKQYSNPDFAQTNMVESLLSARPWIEEAANANQGLIISYGDIIFTDKVLTSLLDCKGDLCVAIDKGWRDYWSLRMENPLTDAETLKISSDGFISELGKKPNSYQDIEGQYIGLQKWQANVMPVILNFYDQLDRAALYDKKDFCQMFMTSFIQLLINSGLKITPAFINHGWLEFDTISDMSLYKDLAAKGALKNLYEHI